MGRRGGWVGLICGIIGGLLAIWNEAIPLRWHVKYAESIIQQSWLEKVRQVASLLYEHRENPSAWQAHPDVLFLRYGRKGTLLEWNTTGWPLPQTIPSLDTPTPELLQDDQTIYYALKAISDTTVQVALVPILIQPPQKGIYREWYISREIRYLPPLCINRKGQGVPFTLPDLRERALLRLYIGCPQALRLPLRWTYLSLFGVSIVIGLFYLWHFLKKRYKDTRARWVFLGVLVGLWQFFHWTELPGRLIPSEFFSAEKCAITPIHTSLWDVGWTLLIVLWLTTLLPSANQRRLHPVLYSIGFCGVWCLFGGGLYLLLRHSQIEVDPLRHLSIIKLVGWGLTLLILWRYFTSLVATIQIKQRFIFPLGVGLGLFLGWIVHLAWWVVALLGVFYLIVLIRDRIPTFLLQGSQAVLVVGILDGWIDWAHKKKAQMSLRAYAPQVALLRNPHLEYRMAQVLPRLATDTSLWSQVEVEDYLIDARFISTIIQKHLYFLAENYEIIVSCWSPDGLRLDNLFEARPLPKRQVLPPAAAPTLAPHLYFVTQGWPRYFYVARVPVGLPGFTPLEVQIELHPRSFPLQARLYPLEEQNFTPISYAIYEGTKLVRQWGEEPFPPYLPSRHISGTSWRTTPTFYEYVSSSPQGLVSYLRYPKRDMAHHLATIPILLALLGIVGLGENFSYVSRLLQSLYKRKGPLSQQLQALFWGLVALPLFGLIGVSFLLFLKISQAQIRQTLVQRLTTVSSYLSGDPVLLEKLRFWLQSYLAAEESFVRDLMQRVARLSNTEVFLYTHQGMLYSSTLPRAYWNSYAVPLLEPKVIQQMRRPGAETFIDLDPTGKRLMGYVPLRDELGRLIGVLHIPMPLSQKAFQEPLRYFIGYAVNVYLILILGSIALGILLIRRFSKGLERVAAQLRESAEGMN
ncbi:MAG: hypothetical protein RMJ66_05935, partial [Bacteroidia bacterium]|nr:hypothetical protein [Bacteroidia bacterium]MDW8134590.1 hypothetical protein [Bacteroidia bacterium]